MKRLLFENNFIRAVCWLALGQTLLAADPLDSWSVRGSGTTATLVVLTYGGNQFVAVGLGGTILTSPDGVDWTAQASGTARDIYSVTYGAGQFVAVGPGGLVLTSPDGVVWSGQNSGSTADLYNICYGKNLYVAVGNGAILISSNGIAWTSRAFGYFFNAVTFASDSFVTVGGYFDPFFGTPVAANYMSTDGYFWAESDPPSGVLIDVTFGAGIFLAVGTGGSAASSTNGFNWIALPQASAQTLNSVTFARNTFVATGNGGTIVTSSDGASWSNRTSGTSQILYEVAYGNRSFVTVGDGGTILQSGFFPKFAQQPQSQAVRLGTNVTLSVSFEGTGTPIYQWLRNNARLDGATNASLTFSNAQPDLTGDYTVEITDLDGTYTSDTAHLVVGTAPVFTQQPQSQTLAVGSSVVLSVSVSNTAVLPITYRWRHTPSIGTAFVATNILNTATSTYTLTNLQLTNAGIYTVVVTNAFGFATGGAQPSLSSNAYITVVLLPTNQVAVAGADVTLTAMVNGSSPLTYQWRFNGNDIGGATSTNLFLPHILCSQAGVYSLTVTNAARQATSFDASLTVLDAQPPALSCPPNMALACTGPNGAQAVFNATASDNCDPNVMVICTPSSGSFFSLGTNTVSCAATDSSGNTNHCFFTIMVQDEVSPTLNILQEGTNVFISWPQTCAPFVFEETSDVSSPTNWTSSGAVPALSGEKLAVRVSMDKASKFYRLRKR